MPRLRRLRIEKYEGIVILFRVFLDSQTSQDGRLARCLKSKDLSEELYSGGFGEVRNINFQTLFFRIRHERWRMERAEFVSASIAIANLV